MIVRPEEISARSAPSTSPLKHCDMKFAQLTTLTRLTVDGFEHAYIVSIDFDALNPGRARQRLPSGSAAGAVSPLRPKAGEHLGSAPVRYSRRACSRRRRAPA